MTPNFDELLGAVETKKSPSLVVKLTTSDVFDRITNLSGCEDGLYVVVTCNEHHDWETGNLEDYDYQLLPYEPPKTTQTTQESL